MLTIRLPPLFKDLDLAAARGQVSIEHAALDARVVESLLATALARPGETVVVAPAPERARQFLSRWLAGRKIRRITGARVWGYEQRGRCLWLVGATAEPDAIPTHGIDALFVVDAQRVRRDWPSDLGVRVAGPVVVAGELAPRAHWSYRFGRAAGARLVRWDANDVAAAFPDQESRILPESDPRRPRAMLLKDVEPRDLPFSIFARRRLKVRTDRAPERLSERQRAEAVAQLGDGWMRSRVGNPVVSLELHPITRRYLAMKRLGRAKGHRLFIVCKYRRVGVTTTEQADSYGVVARESSANVLTLAHKKDSARRIFRMVKLFAERDPEAPPLVGDSKTELEFANGSLFFVGTAGSSGEARGDALRKFHGSEVAKWCRGPNQVELVDDLVAGLLAAASNGEGVLESTPDGREWFWQTWDAAKKGLNPWYPIFLRWFDDPTNVLRGDEFEADDIVQTLTAEETDLVARHGLSPAQIAWRRAAKRRYGRLFAQEFPEDDETCFLVSGTCYFDTDFVIELVAKLPDYARRHLPGGYEVEWEAPLPDVAYAIGGDTSEGLPGCDPSGLGVIRLDTGAQVAATHGLFSIRAQADHAARLARRYNNALLGIERENHGHAVIQKVIDLGYGTPHYQGGGLFYFQRQGEAEKLRKVTRVARAGWSTNELTRPIMLAELADALREGSIPVRDRDFLGECLSFRLQSNGKFAADPGAHDDCVMKWAIAWQMRKHQRPRPTLEILEGSV